MIAALVIAAATATAQPTVAATGDTPLREVVYHASYTRHERITDGSYTGDFFPHPNVGGNDQTDDGTVTVDVMAIASDTLGIRLTESWRLHPRPAKYLLNVSPDGALHFGDQPISEPSIMLLPMFGPLWMHGQPLDPGAKWTVKYQDREAAVTTSYDVTSVSDTMVTVQETQKVDVQSVHGMTSVTTGTIVYNAGRLVPIRISLERRSTHGDADNTDDETMVINVDRVSDTLDSGP
jgi:hypothetical protein